MPVSQTEEAPQVIAGGTRLTPTGGIRRDAAIEATPRGGSYYISIDMRGASRRDTVEVIWFGPDQKVIRTDRKRIPPQAQHVVFATGETRAWERGTYVAEVFVNDRKATVKPFRLL